MRKEGQQGNGSRILVRRYLMELWKEWKWLRKLFRPINIRLIEARKAAFLENKQKSGNSSKRVLHEMVEGLRELMDLADSYDEDSRATAFFQDSSENIKTDSSSEAEFKDVVHALADIHANDGSYF